ncbi:MarR family transcriptional regulator [Microbacterium protaetiae]|uniref:MarR family transcriptional regulator n=1 Tax=Microbacterium protaetiae TaxID=2509458 RepID=A0A4P6EDI7_9MICO|nr:MarR family winged helix-turn-helix transcriptional regulator [Microbacterium protaetiae]QAY60325.1 MarR family transcriptional regulator [Microbacterium protaetiae]
MSTPPSGAGLGRRLSGAVVLFHQALAERVGLSAADLKTLQLIESEGPFTASELARETGLTAAGVTSVIARLSAGGHIVRETDAVDRRRAVIRAVPQNDSPLAAEFGRLGGALGAVIADYSAAEQAAITEYLERMIEVLRAETIRLGDHAG